MQKYSNTTESPKLSIDATVTQLIAVKKEIPLPYYFKNGNYICKVVTKEHYIKVVRSTIAPLVCIGFVEYNLNEIGAGEAITEDEFEYAYENALTFIQTIKENADPSNEPDENVQIDEMLYDQR